VRHDDHLGESARLMRPWEALSWLYCRAQALGVLAHPHGIMANLLVFATVSHFPMCWRRVTASVLGTRVQRMRHMQALRGY